MLKISGEALQGKAGFGVDPEVGPRQHQLLNLVLLDIREACWE